MILVPFGLLAQLWGVSLADSLATPGNLGAFLVTSGYVVISLTDKLIGYLARSRNEVTTFGSSDPIADKLIVGKLFLYSLEWQFLPGCS